MILILFAFNCFYYSVFAQSKKEQIQSLNYRIDSLSNIIIVERQEMDKLQNKIQESKSLLQGFESKKDSLSKELNNNVTEYVKKYNNMVHPTYQIFHANYLSTASMQLQKYEKNIGKYVYHEDSRCDFNDRKIRKLTFLWYLNDVDEGGETEFWSSYRIKPEAGKLVLFPASWTFPHKGNVPISNNKYIITGWLWQQYDK